MAFQPLTRCLARVSPIGVRSLFSNSALGIDNFERDCSRERLRFADKERHFASRAELFKKNSTPTEVSLVMHEDLKLIIKLCESDSDVDVCLEMLKRFNKQNRSTRFGVFTFGPLVLRMLHILDKPEYTLEVFQNPEFRGLFSQPASYLIAMNLLYKHKLYTDVLDLFQEFLTLQIHGFRYPRDSAVLMMAACYHIGTEESFEFAIKFIRNARKAGGQLLRKGLTFAAAHAIKLEKPLIALEILAITAQMNNVTVSNLRQVAMSQTDRYGEIFDEFRSIIHEHHYLRQGHSEVCKDTLDRIRERLEKSGDTESISVLSQLKRGLEEGNHISEFTIAELLELPMDQELHDRNRPTMFKGQRQFRPSGALQDARRD